MPRVSRISRDIDVNGAFGHVAWTGKERKRRVQGVILMSMDASEP